MNKQEFKRELNSYELNLPYPFSCFPEAEHRKFVFMFMTAEQGMEMQRKMRM